MLTGTRAFTPVTHPTVIPLAHVFVAIAALMALAPSAMGALSFSPGYGGTTVYTQGNGDAIYSFDWGTDGGLYFGTVDSSYRSGGIYRYDGSSTSTIQAASSSYAGSSVVAIGSSIYFNDAANSPSIYRYNISGSSTTSISATNYSLGGDGTNLVTTGSADFVTTHISYYASGALSGAIDLGGIAGSSGPAAFDMAGNLFYAPGYGDLSIYRWSAIEVAAAVLGNGSPPLSASGHRWIDYGASFASVAGVGALLLDPLGNVIVTLTDFVNPSSVVKFNADGSGSYETILTSNDRLGELRMSGGNLFLSETNNIITIIPEPSSMLVALSGLGLLLARKR